MESLVRLVQEQGVGDRVRLLGARDDVRELIAASDLYCQPNLEPEPFGLSLIEAMYAGLPVVTTAAGGALEIVDDTCGELTPLGNVPAVADAIDRLAADASRRDALGAAGRHRARALCAPDLQMPHIERLLASAARPEPAARDGAHAG
jgi:glycosyltransferase involved in cell wall biosynthesis